METRAQQPSGFVANNTINADYNSPVNSGVEQRLYVTDAPAGFMTVASRFLGAGIPPPTEVDL